MTKPVASIILPTYNGSRYIRESIDSCLNQTMPDFELIVVDDCSTDDTPAIVQEYVKRDPRIRYIRHDVNKKLPGGLNTGFAAAQGEYFTWTSDDNVYRPRFLERMIATLRAHPEAGLAYGGLMAMDEQGHETKRIHTEIPQNNLLRNVVLASFLYRREVRDVVGDYDPAMFLCEDYDYWLRIQARFPLVTLDEDLYLYREHPGSLTTQQARTRVEALLRVLLKNELLFAQHPGRCYLWTQIGHVYNMLNQPEAAAEYFRKVRKLDWRIYVRRAVIGPLAWPLKSRWIQWKNRPKQKAT